MTQVKSNNILKNKIVRNCTIPTIGLGTYELKGNKCIDAVTDAIDIGYRHIDTAQQYGNEKEIGEAIRQSGIDRDEVFITDKIWFDKLKPGLLKESFYQSLELLGLDNIDLLLIHWPSPDDVPLVDTLAEMNDLKALGLIRHIGVSNFTPTLLTKAMAKEFIVANQVEYHPFLSQDKLLELCSTYGLYLIAYSPIAQSEVMNNKVIKEIAKNRGKSPAQVALRWLIQQEYVVAIPRSSSHEHRKANFDVFNFELEEEEMKKIFDLRKDMRLIDPDQAPDWE